MKTLHALLTLTLALACAPLAPLAAAPAATAAAEPDWMAVVGPYPRLGTPEAQQELAIMAWLQRARTQGDVARAEGEMHTNLGCFGDLLGQSRDLSDRPLTEALMEQARRDLQPIVRAIKHAYGRPRPYDSFPNLTPALPTDTNSSYPSGHAAIGVVFAQILAQFEPAAAPALRERGGLIGNDRTMAGLHWPSDVAAGQRLGRAFATYWINQPEHRELIKAACGAEWRGKR